MLHETYYAGCYWSGRQDSMDECVRRAAQVFREFAPLDPNLDRWYRPARSRKKALDSEFTPDEPTLRRLFASERNRSVNGFTLGAWNGRDDDEGCAISMTGGTTTLQFPGVCVFNIPSTGPFADRILRVDVFSRALRIMAVAWDVDWGVASSDQYRDLIDQDWRQGRPLTGWIMYLSRQRGVVPPLPDPVRVEPVEGKGTLIILTPERFTVSNPAHVELANNVRSILMDAGLLGVGPG